MDRQCFRSLCNEFSCRLYRQIFHITGYARCNGHCSCIINSRTLQTVCQSFNFSKITGLSGNRFRLLRCRSYYFRIFSYVCTVVTSICRIGLCLIRINICTNSDLQWCILVCIFSGCIRIPNKVITFHFISCTSAS